MNFNTKFSWIFKAGQRPDISLRLRMVEKIPWNHLSAIARPALASMYVEMLSKSSNA